MGMVRVCTGGPYGGDVVMGYSRMSIWIVVVFWASTSTVWNFTMPLCSRRTRWSPAGSGRAGSGVVPIPRLSTAIFALLHLPRLPQHAHAHLHEAKPLRRRIAELQLDHETDRRHRAEVARLDRELRQSDRGALHAKGHQRLWVHRQRALRVHLLRLIHRLLDLLLHHLAGVLHEVLHFLLSPHLGDRHRCHLLHGGIEIGHAHRHHRAGGQIGHHRLLLGCPDRGERGEERQEHPLDLTHVDLSSS